MPINLETRSNDRHPDEALDAPAIPCGRLSVFLDMDGVLAPLAPTPEAVLADPRRTGVIRRLVRALGGRVAIISGRTLAEIDRISGEASPAAAGVHGLVRRLANGEQQAISAAPGIAPAAEAMAAFARDRPGLLMETKGVAVSLHYRHAPQYEPLILDLATDLARQFDLVIQPGLLVVELKTPGADKGSALAAFMSESPFAGSIPIMLGDDLTDEDGFVAASALGGFGIRVGPHRATAARYGLSDPLAVLDWLDRVSAAFEAKTDPS